MDTLQSLRQHQLVIVRRLRTGPLTEFELAKEVASHSGHTLDRCSEQMAEWLDELRNEGLIWSGSLQNSEGQRILAAALTRRGRELVD